MGTVKSEGGWSLGVGGWGSLMGWGLKREVRPEPGGPRWVSSMREPGIQPSFSKMSGPCSFYPLLPVPFHSFFLKYLFLERGREGEREGEKHQCVAVSHAPTTGDLASNPGM